MRQNHTIHYRACARAAVVMAVSLLHRPGRGHRAGPGACSQAGHRGASRRRRLAARLHHPERRRAHRLSAADRELGRTRSTWSLYAAVSYSAKGAAKPALGTVKIEADTNVAVDRSAGELLGVQDHRIELLRRCRAISVGEWSREIAERGPAQRAASSRSIACWPASTRARSSRRTSRA